MVNGRLPVGRGQRSALGVADRDQGQVGEGAVSGVQLGRVESPVQRRDHRVLRRQSQGEAEIVEMAVDHVELVDPVQDHLEDVCLMNGEIVAWRIEMPQGPLDNGDESRGSA